MTGPFRDGRVHVLADRCTTCVFRPGNLMDLHAGRVKSMVDEAVSNGSAITCHQTLPYADHGAQPAVCRGFFDAHHTMPLQVAVRLDLVVYDPAPVSC